MKHIFMGAALLAALLMLTACRTTAGSAGGMQRHSASGFEAAWIRNGEPIIFEGESWYPADDFESLTDAEVYLVGEYKGVPVFVEKRDVRPYNRLYTKFGRNKFRFFEKRKPND